MQQRGKEYVFQDWEAQIVKHCLDYCYHRLLEHTDCGISGVVYPDVVDKLRRQIKIP